VAVLDLAGFGAELRARALARRSEVARGVERLLEDRRCKNSSGGADRASIRQRLQLRQLKSSAVKIRRGSARPDWRRFESPAFGGGKPRRAGSFPAHAEL